jgi:hypothetical protein
LVCCISIIVGLSLGVESPFVASTYRRVSELDEGWFSNQTGAESPCNRPGAEPPNYSTSIEITSIQSIGDSFSREGGDSDGSGEGFGDGGEDNEEHYDNFEFLLPGSAERNRRGQDEDDIADKIFLDRMETSLFSFENKHSADSVTFYESDEVSEYDGEPSDHHYFGEEARASFFALYHR